MQNNNKLIDNLKNERNSINSQLRQAVNVIQILKNKKTSQKFEEEPDDDTDSEYDNYGFNKYGIFKDTNLSYDLNNFYINGKNRFTNNKHDINGFDVNGIHKDTKTKYDSNGFDINGVHKDISINWGEDIDEEKMLKNTLWLKNRYNFLKSYIKLLKEKNITETVNNKVISLEIFKNFMNAILSGAIDNNNIKEAYDQYLNNIKKYLDESKSSKNVDKLKNYLIKIKNLVNKNNAATEYDTDIPLETEEEATRDDTRKKGKSDFNEYNIDINSLNKDGYNINGVDENGVDKNRLNINGIKGTRKNIQKEKLIGEMMIVFCMISMDLI